MKDTRQAINIFLMKVSCYFQLIANACPISDTIWHIGGALRTTSKKDVAEEATTMNTFEMKKGNPAFAILIVVDI